MLQRYYPLNVMHNYEIPARDAADFAELIERVDIESLDAIDAISAQRRRLLAYGAVVLDEIIRRGKAAASSCPPAACAKACSTSNSSDDRRAGDPLLSGARIQRAALARARHGRNWPTGSTTSSLHRSRGNGEDDACATRPACSDIAWRAIPTIAASRPSIVANAIVGVDHPGRAYLGMAMAYRPRHEDVSPLIAASRRRACSIARASSARSSASPISSRPPCRACCRAQNYLCVKGELRLTMPADLADLGGEKFNARLKQLGS